MPPRLSQSSMPHSVSLKVLRLSKPSLTPTFPLPSIPGHPSLQAASLAYPSSTAPSSAPKATTDADADTDTFTLAPILTLPPSFGAAYVGETFSCTLSANNEARRDSGIVVKNVHVAAELQTPSGAAAAAATGAAEAESREPVVLEVEHAESMEGVAGEEDQVLRAGCSRQGIIRHDLRDEGPHVLAVTVGYTEVVKKKKEKEEEEEEEKEEEDKEGEEKEGGEKEGEEKEEEEKEEEEQCRRTFRKLYQFSAQQAIGVRTKIGELKMGGRGSAKEKKKEKKEKEKDEKRVFTVEAQVENLTAGEVVLDIVRLELAHGVVGCGLNESKMWLGPGDVEQVAFRLEEEGEIKVEGGRYVLAQLRVDWRMAMGQDGTLKTGWLGCSKRS